MRIKKSSLYIFLSVCILSVLLVGSYYDGETTVTEHYILKEQNGILAIFSEDGTLINSITEANLNTLPDEEKEKLKNGIDAFSQEELVSLIEDFLC